MQQKYISDIITDKDISQWQPNDKVLITGQTGCGKSEFVRTKLFNYAKNNNKKILWLTNRNILKNQLLESLDEERIPYIDVRNYQSLEASISFSGWTLFQLFEKYDYIIYDEVHSLFADSSFSRKTDLLLEPLKESSTLNKVIIFITATPQQLLLFRKKYNYKYTIPSDYSYIENLYFYSRDETLQNIIDRIPSNEKIIYFANMIEDAKSVADNYNDTKFICSEFNTQYKRYIHQSTVKEIEQTDQFSTHLLCTTKVMDNGINLKDLALKHIIIDIHDPIELLQCLGRKRILNENDRIVVYLRERNPYEVQGYLNRTNAPLADIDELRFLGNDEFITRRKRDDFDSVIHNDLTINLAKEIYLQHRSQTLKEIQKIGFSSYICELLGINKKYKKNADKIFETLALTEVLEKYKNRKLFSDEKEIFKNLFVNISLAPRKKDRNRGIHTINGIMEDSKLEYVVTSSMETKGENKGLKYWIIEEKK